MGATLIQSQAVVTLGVNSEDGTDSTEAIAFNDAYGTVSSVSNNQGNIYQVEANDPHQLAGAYLLEAKVTFDVDPVEGHASLDLTVASPTVDLAATLEYKGETIDIDSAFNYTTIAASLSVDVSGLITYDGTGTGAGDVRIEWKKNPSIFTTRRVNYTP